MPLPAPPSDGNLGPFPASQLPELSKEEESRNQEQNNANSVPTSVATHTRSVGIIHPPPDIKIIVDKTARFVAMDGPGFEKRIIAQNPNNAKFSFLSCSDPYHAYYQHRLSEHIYSGHQPPLQPGADAKPDPAVEFRSPPSKDIKKPDPEQYTVRLPEGISWEELDIIKLVALFVARCGKSFLQGLSSREMNNPQFNFLRPTHSMFTCFTQLADSYSKVLMPSKDMTEKLRESVVDMTTILERCLHRLEWESLQERVKQKAEDEIEEERQLMQIIDWHDFSVVETIDFADDEVLPPPMTLEEVRKSKVVSTMEEEEIVEPGMEVEMDMDEEEVRLVEEGMKVNDEPEPLMRIVKNWKRPEERIPAETDHFKFVVSPITRELIPINEMSEHIRISLIDPKFKEQREKMFAKIRETTLAQDDEISRNIVGLARTRPDIFGTTEEEVSNAVMAEIEKKKDEQPKQVIWDGHTGSIGSTAYQAMSQNTNKEDRSDAKNLLGPAAPPPCPGVPLVRPLPRPPGLALNLPRIPIMPSQYTPMAVNFFPLPVPPQVMPMVHPPPTLSQGVPPPLPEEAPPSLPEEPEPKRQKHDDSVLIPEDQFLAQHPGPVRISVSVPNMDEGNLRGQVLEITVQALSETVSSLKEKIAAEIQLPANKQKLSGKPGFLKDNMSLAYYNVAAGEPLSLSLRERGGRKR